MLWMIYLQKYVLNKTKSVHFTVFNMITRINEARTLIHVLVNANSITQDVIQIKKKKNETCQCEYKNYRT